MAHSHFNPAHPQALQLASVHMQMALNCCHEVHARPCAAHHVAGATDATDLKLQIVDVDKDVCEREVEFQVKVEPEELEGGDGGGIPAYGGISRYLGRIFAFS